VAERVFVWPIAYLNFPLVSDFGIRIFGFPITPHASRITFHASRFMPDLPSSAI